MKGEKKTSCLIAAALAFCISFGGIACMVTGFSMDTKGWYVSGSIGTEPASLLTILFFCAIFSLVVAVCFSFPRGWRILAGIAAVLLAYLLLSDLLVRSFQTVLYRITYIYHKAYNWGILGWNDVVHSNLSPNVGLCIIAAVPSVLVVWTVCSRCSAIGAVAAGFLPLITCFVVTDTVPESWCLFLLLAGQIVLILTNTVRRRSAVDANRLTALLLVPSVLSMSLLFWAVPREGYTVRTDSLQQGVLSWLQQIPFVQTITGGNSNISISGHSFGKVDLTAIGPQNKFVYAIMDVTAPNTSTLYLRGQALDVYNGESWSASNFSNGPDNGWPTKNLTQAGMVTVTTRAGQSMLFFPYYPGGENWENQFTEGRINNPHRIRTYSFMQMTASELQSVPQEIALSAAMQRKCLEIPQSTRLRAREHIHSLNLDLTAMTNREIADVIGRYVGTSASYDLDTERMPETETDFAMWFLESSDTGYCVHFASAAVVLLRAAKIPARYVSGYVASAIGGEKVTVTADRAHAWVEYFDPQYGWQILDPTPISFEEEPQPSTGQSEPSQTDPSDSQPTEPSESQPTEPSESQQTEPSVPDVTQPTGPVGGKEPSGLKGLWKVLKTILWLMAACAVIVGQYLLRRYIRRKHMHTGPSNQRALARWQEVIRMCRILKKKPPERLLILAEKAKFSQYNLTAGERMEFDKYLNTCKAELAEKPVLKKTLLRLIWAVE